MVTDSDVLEAPEVKNESKEKHQNSIVLFNDDHNSFDYVIDILIEVCEHEPNQAEQCTMIVHYNGKCDVKTGELEDLKPMCKTLNLLGLIAEIQ